MVSIECPHYSTFTHCTALPCEEPVLPQTQWASAGLPDHILCTPASKYMASAASGTAYGSGTTKCNVLLDCRAVCTGNPRRGKWDDQTDPLPQVPPRRAATGQVGGSPGRGILQMLLGYWPGHHHRGVSGHGVLPATQVGASVHGSGPPRTRPRVCHSPRHM